MIYEKKSQNDPASPRDHNEARVTFSSENFYESDGKKETRPMKREDDEAAGGAENINDRNHQLESDGESDGELSEDQQREQENNSLLAEVGKYFDAKVTYDSDEQTSV